MQMEAIIEKIRLERIRQVTEEGYGAEHDDEHDNDELANAAACYAYGGDLWDGPSGPHIWPFEELEPTEFIGRKSRERQLVIAGALIVAELQRLWRAKQDEPVRLCPTCNEPIVKGYCKTCKREFGGR